MERQEGKGKDAKTSAQHRGAIKKGRERMRRKQGDILLFLDSLNSLTMDCLWDFNRQHWILPLDCTYDVICTSKSNKENMPSCFASAYAHTCNHTPSGAWIRIPVTIFKGNQRQFMCLCVKTTPSRDYLEMVETGLCGEWFHVISILINFAYDIWEGFQKSTIAPF